MTDSTEDVESKFKHLKDSMPLFKDALSKYVKENAATLFQKVYSVAPFGSYSKLLEEPEEIINFVTNEAYKQEHWKISDVLMQEMDNVSLYNLVFANTAIDEGNSFYGSVFITCDGTIRHIFAQGKF